MFVIKYFQTIYIGKDTGNPRKGARIMRQNRLAGGGLPPVGRALTWAARWNPCRFLLLFAWHQFVLKHPRRFRCAPRCSLCSRHSSSNTCWWGCLIWAPPILCWSRSSTRVLLLTAGNLVPMHVAFISAPSLAWKESSFTGSENSTVNKEKHICGGCE